MKTSRSPRAAVTVAAILSLAPPALADTTTTKVPTPPNFSGKGQPPAPPPAAPTPPDPATPPVQVGTPVPTLSVNPADQRGFAYEKRRIKRTVPLDLVSGVAGRWDLLYAVGEGDERKAVYFDWDDDHLYLAGESAGPTPVRFDLDARGDGWFRGADNLRIAVAPAAREGGLPRVTAQRWDTVQNKNRPVWAESPVPVSALKTAAGRTPAGTYAVLLAIPRTEAAGLPRKAGAGFGLRVEFGLPPALEGAALYLPRPLLGLVLAETVEARGEGVRVRVDAGPSRIVPGEGVRATLEVENEGASPVRLARLFLRGSQAAQPFLDAATFTGQTLPPGEKIRREFRSAVSPEAGLGAHVVTGGAEVEGGTVLAALASFDQVDPFAVSLTLEDKPVAAGATEKRTVLVTVRSRDKRRAEGKIALQLPPGWTLEKGDPSRDVAMTFAGEIKPFYYELVVPASAPPGEYPIQADVRIGDRSYTAAGAVRVTRGVAAP